MNFYSTNEIYELIWTLENSNYKIENKNNTKHWTTLRKHSKRLEFRNNIHRNFDTARSRVQEADKIYGELLKCLENEDSIEVALQLYLKLLGWIDETDSILADGSNHYKPYSNTSNNNISYILQQVAIKLESNSKNENQNFVNENLTRKPGKSLKFKDEIESSRKTSIEIHRIYDNRREIRDLWSTQIEFFLSSLGYIIGVGNTLRFPSMIFRYGGTFFIPYILFMTVLGLPLVYMHLCIGQYTGLSASGAFAKMMPLASGIGWALVLLAIPVAIYYNIIVAWSIYYFWYSLIGIFAKVEWSWNRCEPEWASKYNCCELVRTNCYENPYAMTSTEAFFHYGVLNRTLIADPQMGTVQSHLLFALLVAWVLVCLGVFNGLGSIGWAVTFTATIPYLLLLILLLRGISLEGASKGLEFLFAPDFRSLWSLAIWKSAAEQVFYSLGIDAGPLISMASFSRYRNNIYRDAILFVGNFEFNVTLVFSDTFTSLLCAMVIFSFIGFLATQEEKHITEILKHESLYISFTVYPAATSFMEYGFLWASLFFAMVTLSAIDAEFAWLEMIASSVMDCVGCTDYRQEKRLLLVLCLLFFLCGIPLTAQGGIFIFHSIENLNANWNSFSLSLLQVIIVCYVYGVDNFLDDMASMLRINSSSELYYLNSSQNPLDATLPNESILSNVMPQPLIVWRRVLYFFSATGLYVKWSWCFFCPAILSFLLVMSVWSYEPLSFNGHRLPTHYATIAWVTMVGPLLVMPIIIIYTLYDVKKTGKLWRSVVSTENWQNKPTAMNNRIEHAKISDEDQYWYIDPLSRSASAKSKAPFPKISISYVDSDGVEKALEEPEMTDMRKRVKISELEERISAQIAAASAATTPSSQSNNLMAADDEEVMQINFGESLLSNEVRDVDDDEHAIIEVIPDDSPSLERFSAFAGYKRRPSTKIDGTKGVFAMDAIQIEVNASNNQLNTIDANATHSPPKRIPTSNVWSNVEEVEEGTSAYRRAGRIRDYESRNNGSANLTTDRLSPNQANNPALSQASITPSCSNSLSILANANSARKSKDVSRSSSSDAPFLFGPPPQMVREMDALPAMATTRSLPLCVRRSRSDRRSDQRKNRAFRDFDNLVEMVEVRGAHYNNLPPDNTSNLSLIINHFQK